MLFFLQFDMASADGTHLWGYQSRLPHQPQLYEFQLDLAAEEGQSGATISARRRPAARHQQHALLDTTAHLPRSSRAVPAAVAQLGKHDPTAAAAAAEAAAQPASQHLPRSSQCTKFSLLAPEYSSDMPVTSQACHGPLLLMAALAK